MLQSVEKLAPEGIHVRARYTSAEGKRELGGFDARPDQELQHVSQPASNLFRRGVLSPSQCLGRPINRSRENGPGERGELARTLRQPIHRGPTGRTAVAVGLEKGRLQCLASSERVPKRVRHYAVVESGVSRRKPWRSSKRYNVVRSTLASRAARDMLPDARATKRVTYSFSKFASTCSFAR